MLPCWDIGGGPEIEGGAARLADGTAVPVGVIEKNCTFGFAGALLGGAPIDDDIGGGPLTLRFRVGGGPVEIELGGALNMLGGGPPLTCLLAGGIAFAYPVPLL